MWFFKKNNNDKINLPEIRKISFIENEPLTNAYIDIENYIKNDNLKKLDPFIQIVLIVALHLCSCAVYFQRKINIFKWIDDFNLYTYIINENEDKSVIPLKNAFKFSTLFLKRYDSNIDENLLRHIYQLATIDHDIYI